MLLSDGDFWHMRETVGLYKKKQQHNLLLSSTTSLESLLFFILDCLRLGDRANPNLPEVFTW